MTGQLSKQSFSAGLSADSLTVIIPSFNVRDLLAKCLASINENYETIVVDNASQDGTGPMVREKFPQVDLIELERNLGFSAAVNAGAKKSKAEYLLLLNPDIYFPENVINKMVQCIKQRPKALAMGFRQVDSQGQIQLSVGSKPWLMLELLRRQIQRGLDHRKKFSIWCVEKYLAEPRCVSWVAGSCILVKRQAFETIGGFDEEYFLYFEDIDFCLRLAKLGGEIWYEPNVTLVHHRGASAATEPHLAETAYRQSQLRFWQKHRGPFIQNLVKVYQRVFGHMKAS